MGIEQSGYEDVDDIDDDVEETAPATVPRWSKTQRAELKQVVYDRATLRAFVDFRYSGQLGRKGIDNRVGAIGRRVDTATPSINLLAGMTSNFRTIEANADLAIKQLVEAHEAGRWAVSIPGIAHTFAGVLLAYIDLHPWVCEGNRLTGNATCNEKEPCTPTCHKGYVNTAGKVWRFAGVDPTIEWAKGQKRPYCALLKTVTWQIGEAFKKLGVWVCPEHGIQKSGERKVKESPDEERVVWCKLCHKEMERQPSPTLYARLYRERKAQEIARNEAGLFRDQALARLAECVAKKRRISDLQRETWGAGKLQPIGLDYRAGRYAAKIFLSHFHHVLHEVEEGFPPPVPYIVGPGAHADFIAPPNWPMKK